MKKIIYFNNLRAVLMCMVVIFHAMLPYSTPDFYPYLFHSTKHYVLINNIMLPMHCIMMPIFFLLSGYFAHGMLSQKGRAYFINERLIKLAIPFAIGMILFIPPHIFTYVHALFMSLTTTVLNSNAQSYSSNMIGTALINSLHNGTFYHAFFNPEYLWFLYYLLIYCALSLCLPLIPVKIQQHINILNHSKYALLLITVLLWVTLYFFNLPYISTPTTLTPSFQPLITYGIFYLLGWHYFANPKKLIWMKKQYLKLSIYAMMSLLIYTGFMIAFFHIGQSDVPFVLTLSITLFLTLSLITTAHAFVGLFARFMDFKNQFLSYLANISYWVYLIKFPFLILLQYYLIQTNLPIFLQIILAAIGAIALSAVAFEVFVKPTFIHKILKGKYQLWFYKRMMNHA